MKFFAWSTNVINKKTVSNLDITNFAVLRVLSHLKSSQYFTITNERILEGWLNRGEEIDENKSS